MKKNGLSTNHLVSCDLNSINDTLLNSNHLHSLTNPIPPTPALHEQMSVKDDDTDDDSNSTESHCSTSSAKMDAFLH